MKFSNSIEKAQTAGYMTTFRDYILLPLIDVLADLAAEIWVNFMYIDYLLSLCTLRFLLQILQSLSKTSKAILP